MRQRPYRVKGELVGFPVKGSRELLDGFWAYGRSPKKRLVVFVHGMGGNNKTMLIEAARNS